MKVYRNKKIAHLAVKKGRFKNPKLNEITKAIAAVDQIMRKYFLAINCSAHLLDFGHVNITDIFTKAWVENDSSKKKLLDAFEKDRKKRERIKW